MIHFFVEDVSFSLSDQSSVTHWLDAVARSEGVTIAELNYIFCSDDYLLCLNQQYLNHDYYTDVITFDHRDHPTESIAGDVYISYDRVVDNSSQFNFSVSHELHRVMVHGLLHLIGYGDDTESGQQFMRQLEDQYLSDLREIRISR